jgi:hypothetical protein
MPSFRIFMVLCCLLSIVACDPSKRLTTTPTPPPKPTTPTLPGSTTEKPVEKPDNNTTKPDTTPTGTGKPDLSDKGGTDLANKTYELALLLPLYTDKFQAASDSLYTKTAYGTDFLAGVQLATEQLQSEGANLKITVYDSQQGGNFTAVLAKPGVMKADVVIGPAERDNINTAAQWAKTNNKTVVSYFVPSGDIAPTTPNFVQLNPSLESHCAAITNYIYQQHRDAKVVLLARGTDAEPARFAYFQKALKSASGKADIAPYTEVQVNDNSSGLTATNLTAHIQKGKLTIFVVPSWQETFVSAILRRIDLDAKGAKVIVIGMPQWSDFSNIDFMLFEKLNVLLCSANYIDRESEEWLLFKNDFFDRYNKAPNKDAITGYDTALYVGRMVRKYGPKFQYKADLTVVDGLQSHYRLSPIAVPYVSGGTDAVGNTMKYENSGIFLLAPVAGKLQPVVKD